MQQLRRSQLASFSHLGDICVAATKSDCRRRCFRVLFPETATQGPSKFFNLKKLWKARSRLYRGRFVLIESFWSDVYLFRPAKIKIHLCKNVFSWIVCNSCFVKLKVCLSNSSFFVPILINIDRGFTKFWKRLYNLVTLKFCSDVWSAKNEEEYEKMLCCRKNENSTEES